MSMDRCTKCGDIVDTDFDCSFYDFTYTLPKEIGGHCVNCREAMMETMTDAQQAEHEKRVFA
jgi:hypothetical protein